MTGVTITRVGELRKSLASFADDDFVYVEVSRGGASVVAASQITEDGESTMGMYPIITLPLTNKLPQDQILRLEAIYKELQEHTM